MEIKKELTPYVTPTVHVVSMDIGSIICASGDSSPITLDNPFEDFKETDW